MISLQDWTKVPYASSAGLLPALDRLVRELQRGSDVKVGKLGFYSGKHGLNCLDTGMVWELWELSIFWMRIEVILWDTNMIKYADFIGRKGIAVDLEM